MSLASDLYFVSNAILNNGFFSGLGLAEDFRLYEAALERHLTWRVGGVAQDYDPKSDGPVNLDAWIAGTPESPRKPRTIGERIGYSIGLLTMRKGNWRVGPILDLVGEDYCDNGEFAYN